MIYFCITLKTACQPVNEADEFVFVVSQTYETELNICLMDIWDELPENVRRSSVSHDHHKNLNLKDFFNKNTNHLYSVVHDTHSTWLRFKW